MLHLSPQPQMITMVTKYPYRATLCLIPMQVRKSVRRVLFLVPIKTVESIKRHSQERWISPSDDDQINHRALIRPALGLVRVYKYKICTHAHRRGVMALLNIYHSDQDEQRVFQS